MDNFYLCSVKSVDNLKKYLVVRKEWIYNIGKKKNLKNYELVVFYSSDVEAEKPSDLDNSKIHESYDEGDNNVIVFAKNFIGYGKLKIPQKITIQKTKHQLIFFRFI